MKILVIHGPNLNVLGKRDKAIYGDKALAEIDSLLKKRAETLKAEVMTFQSNSEGTLVDFIQEQSDSADGIIINPGALTHYGYSLRDALADTRLPVVEVHLSNIYAREEWRAKSVIAPIARGQISGLGWRGYIAALESLIAELKGADEKKIKK
ncbi:MAG: type II 3-dehydroquinate dehydratase [Chloroflexi bacterium CG_4_9_14_3_um_filter_45_9]|nr:MAG: type II 3-dehydroquinate dehydratase [Dehalococcoidia bacterium CG2_30_46_9]PIU23115.1 MAG: type II 3-dehydroquinate dehydratase [Chloroflexi bacterium CG08_land_8_20_14_0_20_45_12]PIX27748.1 MAG: type II 3-dehydroquinate dehydratase [Chloroflexi bacterium CG_4_8_14_3_um_filter_45_15]PJB49516.1 MAG: type II 3-dehydroquinate dehydratase [Chloroflexi bacterium CG_4_9_14_3_um_filter_45_9]